MSYCKDYHYGKDQVIFATKDQLNEPSNAIINMEEDEEDHPPGLILPNGDINWECPCLGGMASGPCGIEFRNAFSCFHYSKAEPKGSDCYESFLTMQECMSHFPEVYPPAKERPESDDLKQLTGDNNDLGGLVELEDDSNLKRDSQSSSTE
ncbi:mitochondrial intermembrane space import and assembly protein 40 [Biomphalaria pfeifferi]|uniref:Mitochondrial intermembrane space import and assembly protein 40 n=1 Tax=Biomphalaria pfeifferi TaxID=112525 RepID=A0AAD8B990_BIOPF|nr:mitochondrial intermembrane space import and assembly protein 40 [Biomphalaria pfeifferi]